MKLGSLEEGFRRSAFDVIYVDGHADGDEKKHFLFLKKSLCIFPLKVAVRYWLWWGIV